MAHECQSAMEEREMLQKHNPSISEPHDSVRENSAGDGSKTIQPTSKTTNNSQRIDDLEKLIGRLNNAMLTLEEENLKLHKRLKNNIEARANVIPDHGVDTRCKESQTFPLEGTERSSSNAGLLQQDDKYGQLKAENSHLKKTLKETEKCSKQYARDLQRLLQKYEDMKAQNQLLEQCNKQLVPDKGALEKKLDIRHKAKSSQTSRSSQTEVWHVDPSRMHVETGHGRRLSSENSIANDGAQHTKHLAGNIGVEEELSVTETVAHLREKNRRLQEDLIQSIERGIQTANVAMSLKEEHVIMEGCLETMKHEKDLLQMEVRNLHQDYINLSKSITLHLRDAGESSRPPELYKSHAHTPDVHDVAQSNSISTELHDSTSGSLGFSVSSKSPVIKQSNSTDSTLRDRASERRKSTGSTPSLAPAEHRRTSRGEMERSPQESPTQMAKHVQIDKDTIERIRIRYEENELKDRASERRKSTGSTPNLAPAENRRTSREVEMERSPKESPTQMAKHVQIDKDTIERIRSRYKENELKREQRRVSQ
ncbi:cytadherence high molecular weight protein 2-like [Engraulis encrasicolus]|uniref:cytadherence high molecular weight protein 2-like n=1 Tax=Engraulis encrasicolus TaxID=184585 RepID=UPI002FCFA6A4